MQLPLVMVDVEKHRVFGSGMTGNRMVYLRCLFRSFILRHHALNSRGADEMASTYDYLVRSRTSGKDEYEEYIYGEDGRYGKAKCDIEQSEGCV